MVLPTSYLLKILKMHFCLLYITLLLLPLVGTTTAWSQASCPTSSSSNCDGFPLSRLDLSQQGGGNLIEFVFNEMSKYTAGITYYGQSILRITASDTAASGNCAWNLRMMVNNGGFPTPPTEWVQNTAYGTSGSTPTIGLLEVRVTNNCGTSPINGGWQSFTLAQSGGQIVIIDDGGFVNSAGIGGCGGNGQVNSAGSYLTSYGEFSFIIDYRIKPFFNYTPGKYDLNIKFCISESP